MHGSGVARAFSLIKYASLATRPIPRPVVQPADVQPATVQPWSTPDLEPRRRQGAGTRGPLVALVLGAALVVVAVLLAIQ